MRASGEPEPPTTRGGNRPGALSRRSMLTGAALTAGMAAAGIGTTRPALAAEAGAPVRATARMGGTSITMAVVNGALQWSATRNGKTVVDASALGLRLGRRAHGHLRTAQL